MELITVAVFPNAFNAHLVQGRLHADGVGSYIKDEHTLQVNPLYSNALGGIKLQVKQTDVPVAIALIRQSGYRTVFDTPQTTAKQQHILLRFIKFVAAAVILLGWLYLIDFKDKM
ncbi:MAG: hypothetical protein JST82_15295 [Bacteroidetes bacterium]|nr:hypothetical protein [Bacteroidota bacterium]